ncbi:hypothetical protein EV363DRAFT_821878 [Boletus edulis]|nr:hypothetical protein EV363DRAFT_821878 [Boletus edulis]
MFCCSRNVYALIRLRAGAIWPLLVTDANAMDVPILADSHVLSDEPYNIVASYTCSIVRRESLPVDCIPQCLNVVRDQYHDVGSSDLSFKLT